ncbi:hypothetical protein [Hymenobacter antarcticus]|uniref:Uncharacterized protein n=1 Tax=Hymenobacter antarcticus TaxID=486270 RepID=A0ABP7R4R8_9BACT
MQHTRRPARLTAAPRAARHAYAPSSRAHRLEPLPGSTPPRRPRRPAGAPTPGRRPAVLLYRMATSSYLASLNGTTLEFELFSQPRPLPSDLTAFEVLYMCRPQARYTDKHQCEVMLQSPRKEFLTGLRNVELPQQVGAAGVTVLAVGDYKADRRNRELVGRTLVVAYAKPGTYDTRPGWLLLVVGERPYAPKHRNANASAAVGLMREVLRDLPGWLAPLLAGEPSMSEGAE